MKYLRVAIAVVVFSLAVSIAAATIADGKRKMKIGLMTASLPWSFGPYQSQMHHLSLLLNHSKDDDEVEYDIYWLSYSGPRLPMGIHSNYEEIRPHLGNLVPPPAGFPIDHLKFLGMDTEAQMSAKIFNDIKKEYDLDCLITMMDITKVIPNDTFDMPVIAWMPLHSEKVSSATVDYWVMRMYHGIASLAPSSAKAIGDAVGRDVELSDPQRANTAKMKALTDLYGRVSVEFIPHIFDQKAIMASADVGLELLKDHSVAEADAKLTSLPLINRGQESTLEVGHPRSLFGKERKENFVVLLQGGNYDKEDRKGWNTSLQAFVRFYNSLDDPSGVHLLIHSMESYLIASDSHMNMDAPANVLPEGTLLHFALHEHGLPRDAYTIDIAKHAPEVVAAYKKRADVCLHPSKVEGFGMNVMECQVVGTPVITTNYTAMGDFTKFGRSVPYRQTIRAPNYMYDMALPDVIGIADALGEIHEEHLAMKRGEEKALTRRESEVLRFNDWLDKNCSPEVVGNKFKSLLLRASSEFHDRKMGMQSLYSEKAPTAGAYEIVSGYYSTIVDWDAPWALFAPQESKMIVDTEKLHMFAWMRLLQSDGSPNIMVLPAKYEDGTDVPHEIDGELNKDLPIFVRSYMVTAFQGRMSRRKSLVMSAIQSSGGAIQVMRDGLAIVTRDKDSGTSSDQYQNSEL